MILTELTATAETLNHFLKANSDFVLKATRKGKLIIEISQRFVGGKYQEKGTSGVNEIKLKRIPVNVQSIIRQKHS